MKFTRLDGGEVTIRINPARYPMRSREASRSRGQYNLGRKLRLVYGNTTILEEFTIPGSRLSLDFFIPSRMIAFEFQGIQHDEYNEFFHADKAAFAAQQHRDSETRRWCEENGITLIEVRDPKLKVDDLRTLIMESLDAE